MGKAINDRRAEVFLMTKRDYRRRLAPVAGDGRFELYKTTAQHEGKVGREQHRYPSEQELGG